MRYWERRALIIEDAAFRKSEKAHRFISREYRRAMARIEAALLVYLQRIADRKGISLAKARELLSRGELEQFRMGLEDYIQAGEGELTEEVIERMEQASNLHRITRLQAMAIELDKALSLLAVRYEAKATEVLAEGFMDGFFKMSYEIGVMNGFRTIQKINPEELDAILRRPWTPDGVDFSSRIWTNKEKLLQELQKELTHALIRGGETESAVKPLAQRMQVSESSARRLLHTEMAYFSTQGTMRAMEESGVVEKYEFVATLDSHTSDICREMDGKVFKLSEKEVGLNSPPLHCHCRSVVVPYFGDELEDELDETRMARDPETGKSERVEGGLTYSEWQKKYVAEKVKEGYNGVKKKEFNLQFFGNRALKNQTVLQLRKSIDSNQKRVQEHLLKIKHPEKVYKNWDKMTEQHRKGAIEHWEKEIRAFEKNIRETEEELRLRGEKP